MGWTIAGALVFLWLLGFTGQVGGSYIHILLVIGVVVFVWSFLTGRRTA
jgi:hypothetical protein